MIQFFLAVAFLPNLDTKAPELLAPYKSLTDCEIAAVKLNKSRSPEQIANGAAAVCLQIVGPAA